MEATVSSFISYSPWISFMLTYAPWNSLCCVLGRILVPSWKLKHLIFWRKKFVEAFCYSTKQNTFSNPTILDESITNYFLILLSRWQIVPDITKEKFPDYKILFVDVWYKIKKDWNISRISRFKSLHHFRWKNIFLF